MPPNRFCLRTVPIAIVVLWVATASTALAANGIARLPHIVVDVHDHQVRVDCMAVRASYPLEFLAVQQNTNEYEALLSTQAKPSDFHLALLMIGLKPGVPAHYIEANKTWLPPSGPPVDIWLDYKLKGKSFHVPSYHWMRDINTKKLAPPMHWVFTGSQMQGNGAYAGDTAGYLASVINNELAVLDVPALKSRAMDARQLERDPKTMPPTGTPVTMIVTPMGDGDAPVTMPAASPTSQPAAKPLSMVQINQAKVDRLQQYWLKHVAPYRTELQEAAEAHYEVIARLRKEQQRLVDESDRIQTVIDRLNKEYDDMTTPRPEPSSTTQP